MPKIAYMLLLVPLLTACQTLTEPLAEPAALEGTVMAVAPLDQGRVQLRIETIRPLADPAAVFSDRATVYVEQETKVFRRDGEELKELQAGGIQIGDKVRVWIGAELRSDPPQYNASQVVVEPGS